ncbi:Oligoendopeptidase F, plasmid [compost metagenome]
MSAAISIASKILLKEEGIIEKYMNFLKSGGIDYPLDSLKKLGVDLSKPDPIQDAMNILNLKIEQLEKLI